MFKRLMRISVAHPLSLAAAMLAIAAVPARADFNNLSALDQSQFDKFATGLAAATHYKAITPAEPLGATGFDLGFEMSSTDIDNAVFKRASGGSFSDDTLLVPRMHVHKGLVKGFDIGASISRLPRTGLSVIGGELRYAFISGNVAAPAVALRASYTKVQGNSQFDMYNTGAELTVSKGILMFTPYAGLGYVHSEIDPVDGLGLAKQSVGLNKVFVGMTMNFGVAVTVEADKTDDITSYSAKVGLRF